MTKRLVGIVALLGVIAFGAGENTAAAQSTEQRMKLMEQTLKDLLERDAEKDKIIEKLRTEVQALKGGSRGALPAKESGPAPVKEAGPAPAKPATKSKPSSTDHAHGHGHGHGTDSHGAAGDELPDIYSVEVGGGTLRFRGIGVNTAIAAGGSTVTGETLEQLETGDHDPRQNGFDLQTVDLGLLGSFDPYFDAEVHIALNIDREGETSLELEEAFLLTQEGVLPGGLELEVGQFFTEFGAYNPVHFHDHTFVDQPVIIGRFFGPDGLRGQGLRVGWNTPLPGRTKLDLGVQNATGETQSSFLANEEIFEEQPVGGRAFVEQDVDSAKDLTYLARLSSGFDVGRKTHVTTGVSGLYGPNATGTNVSTYIIGGDVRVRHDLPGGQYLRFQGEFMYRNYEAAAQPDEGFPADDLEDYGLYAYLFYGFLPDWGAGLRGEYATGSGASVGEFDGRQNDPFRSNRLRISPLLTWYFAPTGNVRLQYNYDNADFLEDQDAHSVWLSAQWAFGAGEAIHVRDGGAHAHDH